MHFFNVLFTIPFFFFAFLDRLSNETVDRCCTGLCIDLLKKLGEMLHFDVNLTEVDEGAYGSPLNVSEKQILLVRASLRQAKLYNATEFARAIFYLYSITSSCVESLCLKTLLAHASLHSSLSFRFDLDVMCSSCIRYI